MKHKIGVIVGSLREASFSKRIAKNLIELASDEFELEIVPIGDLPLFNEDFDGDKAPEAYNEFRSKMKEKQGFIFVTPEYNRSMPGCLKNAMDVGSRPKGQSIWAGKPGMVISLSQGNMSGFGANHHLRQVLVNLNVPTMPQPEIYLAKVQEMVDAEGNITNPKTTELLQKALDSYANWFKKLS